MSSNVNITNHKLVHSPLLEAKVVILGSQGVGKTSLVVRYVQKTFSPNCTSTIGASFMTKKLVVDDCKVRLQIWDTAGQERFRSMVLYDITSEESFLDMNAWIEELRKNMTKDLIGNKIDLAPIERAVPFKRTQEYVSRVLGSDYAVHEVSAKDDNGIEELFLQITRRLVERKNDYGRQIFRPNTVLKKPDDNETENTARCGEKCKRRYYQVGWFGQEGWFSNEASEDISKNLTTMKTILFGEGENDPVPEIVAQLAQEVYNNDILQLLVINIGRFEFEASEERRVTNIQQPSKKKNWFVNANPLNCGMILRECIRHESLTKIILYSPQFYNFFEYVEMNTFDIASDAFATFKEILTRHKTLVAEFLDTNYDKFFESYTDLLESNNYVTKRQSLKLLGEILLDRSNFTVMTKYIEKADNLKLMMNLLRDKSRNIQFEAFHVFKPDMEVISTTQNNGFVR
ncbi:7635_t:CDS:10 [Diversispora eburnea]|uniref:7635_t:CDS:1 n=1 Tax=Diversispora eburnea TaxID=1213867 RepID=A0A9N8WGZ5_9GLOM|nr:7635_t:CDS:10 [Diversispora eburnea]